MDNDFNNILNIFKRLNESSGEKTSQAYQDAMAAQRAAGTDVRIDRARDRMQQRADEPKTFVQRVKKDIGEPIKKLAKGDITGALGEEDSMKSAENNPTGPDNYPGYWTGKMSADQAKDKMVGGTAESTEQRIRNKYNQYLKEMGTIGAVGMSTSGSTGTQDPAAAQKTQQELNGVKKELDTAKAKKLLPQTTNTQQAAQGLAALQQAGGDMNKVPGNLKQKIAPVITGIAGALGAGAKNPQQTNKVTQGLGMLGGAAATLE
jgi:hypothetical protein